MKKIIIFIISVSFSFAGRFGIGVAGGGEYLADYEITSPQEIHDMYYGAEFRLQAEALPHVYLEPSLSYLNNPYFSSTAVGVGLGMTFQPRLGRFPIVPSVGIEGTLLLYNTIDAVAAAQDGTLQQYLETSTPRMAGSGFAGLNLFLGELLALNCRYRYHSFAPNANAEMIWAGVSVYLNW
ncbi:MAG: hypothetical protein JSW02_02000 [candidate division WOR-3 bacterium]|nr:MAG: hypothetical protein JSW02_02000 [candidate division WOR-3 bacterium]